MKQKSLNQAISPGDSAGIRSAIHPMVHARARKLAQLAGRTIHDVRLADYEQAKLELPCETVADRHDRLLDALPESKRWDPVPGSEGTQLPESASEDEDNEGRSETEQLVDEGAEEAERERARQAARAAEQAK